MYFLQTVFQRADQVFIQGACVTMLNATSYIPIGGGHMVSFPGHVELPSQLVFSTFIDSYRGSARFEPWDSSTCFLLLTPGTASGAQGTCMVIDGHYGGAPDLFGQTWVVDHLAPCH